MSRDLRPTEMVSVHPALDTAIHQCLGYVCTFWGLLCMAPYHGPNQRSLSFPHWVGPWQARSRLYYSRVVPLRYCCNILFYSADIHVQCSGTSAFRANWTEVAEAQQHCTLRATPAW